MICANTAKIIIIAFDRSHDNLKIPTTEEPTDYGWVEIDNRFEFDWFSDVQLPKSIEEITIQPEKDDDDEDMIAYNSDSDSESEREESDSSQSENEND
ncbi:unnamed protein product [Arctia plantaginis]|uniref:Uncharacterized protein n=1 Tax=Arctia plantaginis TaxID=874455 RepID=A0A8S1A8W8_ARCPL|nr:unnamed protein product [Arctia plantaginis]